MKKHIRADIFSGFGAIGALLENMKVSNCA
jgi:hypothetical protein